MQVKTFTFNPFQENTYLLYDQTKECVIIDAGCYTKNEEVEISKYIENNQLQLVKIINTHCHIDHILGISYLIQKYKVKFLANKNDNYLLENAQIQGKIYGFEIKQPQSPDIYVEENSIIKFGETELKVLDVPGHTRGHIAILNENENCVFVGDVLFKGSIGRTDLPGGDYDVLMKSIKTKLLVLNQDCKVYSGHGSTTTIGYEKFTNPFLT